MKRIFLTPSGRQNRRDFWIGYFGVSVFIWAVNSYLKSYPALELSFWVALVFPFLVLYMTYCVYGKRLHDMGRSYWPLTGLIVALVLLVIIVMLSYGGSEYFSEFAKYERKAVIDEAVRARLIETYQTELKKGNRVLYILSTGLILAFTLWCGLSRSDPASNKYGPPVLPRQTEV